MSKIKLSTENPLMDFSIMSEDLAKEIKSGEKAELFSLSENGLIKPTKYTLYLVISQASKWFADIIVKLDNEKKFHFVNNKEIKDEKEVKKALSKYNAEREKATKLIEKWKNDNKDLFEITYSIPSVAKYVGNFRFDINKINSAEDAIEGYKYSKNLLNKEDWSSIATQPKNTIKPEFKEVYKSEKEAIYKSVGFPGDSVIKNSVTSTVIVPTTRLALNRKPFQSTKSSAIFVEEFCQYLMFNKFEDNNGFRFHINQ